MSITATNNPYPESPDPTPSKLDKGGYEGTAETLDNKINEVLAEVLLMTNNLLTDVKVVNGVTPTSAIPPTGNIYTIVTTDGTYVNWNNLVVPVNSMAVLMRVDGVFSISQTALVLPDGKINFWEAEDYPIGTQRNHLGKDWYLPTSAALSTDIPGTSIKWVERLGGYSSITETNNLLNEDVKNAVSSVYPLEINIDKYLNFSNGSLSSVAGFQAKKYKINPNTIYYATGKTVITATALVSYFDVNNVFISSQFQGVGSTTLYTKQLLTVPVNADFLIVGGKIDFLPKLHSERYSYIFPLKEEVTHSNIVISNNDNNILNEDLPKTTIALYPLEINIDKYTNATTGALATSVGVTSKKYIVSQNTVYYADGKTTIVETCLVSYYNANNVFISSQNIGTGTSILYTKQLLTIPANALYAIVNGKVDKVAKLYKESYGYIFPLKGELVAINRFAGKNMIVTGDSLAASATSMFVKMAAQLGINYVQNYAIGGSRIAEDINLPYLHNPISVRYTEMRNDADLIFVAASSNDANYGTVPFGVFTDRTKNTYLGALHVIASGLKTKYLGKQIVFVTALKRYQDLLTPEATNPQGKTQKDYADAIIEVGKYYGIPVLDMYSNCVVNPFFADYRAAYIPDGTHPSEAGNTLMTNNLVGFMQTL